MNAERIKPMGLAMIICDQVITEAKTNKKSLIGIFNQVFARTFPCRHSRMSIFIVLTGIHNSVKTDIRFDDESGQTLFAAEGQIACENPTQVVEMNFEFNNTMFPEPGQYTIHFMCDGVPLLHRNLFVRHLQEDQK